MERAKYKVEMIVEGEPNSSDRIRYCLEQYYDQSCAPEGNFYNTIIEVTEID